MPRVQKLASKPKHDPLHVQLHEDTVNAKYGSVSQPGKRKKSRRDKSDRESDDEVRWMIYWGGLRLIQL
jgi:essential nuclear protein 1